MFFSLIFGLIVCAILNRIIEFFYFSALVGVLASLFFMVLSSSFVIRRLNLKKEKQVFYASTVYHEALVIIVPTLISFAFLFTIPINIDRSFSVWTLSQIERNANMNQELKVTDLKKYMSTFFDENSIELNRRLLEQQKIGNIIVSGDKVRLTDRGRIQVVCNRFISRIFALNFKYSG